MSPLRPDPLTRARPALAEAEPGNAPVLPPRASELMVRRTDGAVQLCQVRGWQSRGGDWLIHLAWGDSGQVRDAWFVHDPRQVWPAEPSP